MTTSVLRHAAVIWTLVAAIIILAAGCLIAGAVKIPLAQIWAALTGGDVEREAWQVIVMQTRLPMMITALVAGAALSVAGLLMQTCFDNPLAGPSILGISTGASLGVAIVMLWFGGTLGAGMGQYASSVAGALAGSAVVMAILLAFSRVVRSSVMILIIGVLVGYFTSSAISLLNFFSTQEGVHSYVIWGLGNFSGTSLGKTMVFALITVPLTLAAMLLIKPLNALLLGARYAESLGINISRLRGWLLVTSGALTAFVTAFCGPIGFIGLIVPHVARMTLRTSNHTILLPATALCGAATGLLCAFLSLLPSQGGVIPINAITPIIGVPVIIYVIVGRKRLLYFS
ncbi:MAG: iron ABC transporter permease [Firmicutes bacterium]|nr:iron ABC transporter permease [Bacillota bacterium]MCM1401285.1 iron ABC transporter permease [Bacteroides sp.]MCM1476760.1 iron ABC transporter permease [Bacteroides sp.]